jgi:hypothetical protein
MFAPNRLEVAACGGPDRFYNSGEIDVCDDGNAGTVQDGWVLEARPQRPHRLRPLHASLKNQELVSN